MCFFRKRKERKRKEAAEQALMNERAAQEKAAMNEAKPVPNPPKVEQNNMVKPVEASAPVTEPVEPKTKEAIIKEQVKQEVAKPAKAQKYHVSQNKDEDSENFKKWRVRKEGSTKTIKFFDTQKEAIDFAGELAEKAGSSVVIHKVDGSIRKQDYSKKV